jgi:hypothetical protein
MGNKQRWAASEAAADVAGVRKKSLQLSIVVPELVEDCNGWQQRLWRTSLMSGVFFVVTV